MRHLTLLLLLTVACAGPSAQVTTNPSAAVSADEQSVACRVPVPSGEAWRQVRAEGFTFCVPRSWRVRDGRATYTGGSVQWRQGTYSRVPFTVGRVESGRPPPAMAGSRAEQFTETIDDRSAQLWLLSSRGTISTGASWSDPAMYFTGEARDEAMAAEHFAVYRTVRFVERP